MASALRKPHFLVAVFFVLTLTKCSLSDKSRAFGIFSTNSEHETTEGLPKAFGEYHTFTKSSHGVDVQNSEFAKYARAFGLDITGVGRSNGRGYSNQDAYFMELVLANSSDVQPLVVLAVMDGHGPLGHVVSQLASDGALAAVRMMTHRKSTMPPASQRRQRAEALRSNMAIIIGHADAHVDAHMPVEDSSGTTMTVVMWDTEAKLICTGSMGDSPAFIKLKSRDTLLEISENQNMANPAERKRQIARLAQLGLVPVGKLYVGNEVTVLFGPLDELDDDGIRSCGYRRGTGWEALEPTHVRPRKAMVGGVLQSERTDNTKQYMETMDVLSPLEPSEAINHGPHFSFRASELFCDCRYGPFQPGSGLGHRECVAKPHGPCAHLSKTPIITVLDLENEKVEYLIVASDGMTGALDSNEGKQQPDLGKRVFAKLLEWGRKPDILDAAFEAAQAEKYRVVGEVVVAKLQRAVEEAVAAGSDIAMALQELVLSENQKMGGINADDLTILAAKPNHLFGKRGLLIPQNM